MAGVHKNSLTIRLTESVVFLRSADFSGRRSNAADSQPSMLRGLLVLNIAKPTRISSIELELQGNSTTSWPDGIGARRIEVTEEHKIFSASTVFFRAGPTQSSRRTASVGPGLSGYCDDDGPDSADDEPAVHTPTTPTEHPRGRSTVPRAPAGAPTGMNRRVSADAHTFQRDAHSFHEDVMLPTPPYTPTPSHHASLSPAHSFRRDETPAHTLEEFRQALRVGLEQRASPRPSPNASAGSSLHSYREDSLSRRTSIEHVPEDAVSNHRSPPHGYATSPSRERASGSTTPVTPDGAPRDHSRGRRHARFSFTAVSNVLLDAIQDRVRSSSPHREISGDRDRGRDADKKGKGKEVDGGSLHRKHKSTLGKFGGILKLEPEEPKEVGDGWKEFKKGTYTYPISIAIPGNAPPSLDCDYGAVTWRLKAYVHRPGTFVSKLSATREVIIISAPNDDATEETENIMIERQWDSQLQYLISISGRSFYIGGAIPIHFTIMPLTKAKVHRISVLLEERIDYLTQMRRVARTDPLKRIALLALKLPTKDGGPILPLDSDDPDAFANSPLSSIVPQTDEAASTLMGPGPWTFHHDLPLPTSCSQLHFTNKNKRSNVSVSHTLKIIFRVERGDDVHVDAKTGKRKLFDIVVQTPVHILSCRCNPEWTSLPRYSETLENSTDLKQSCPCEIKRSMGAASNTDDSHLRRVGSHRSSDSASSLSDTPISAANTHTTVNPATMPSLRSIDSLFNRNTQFERLVSGLESEAGEAPPAYESVAVH
ncbi:hypothetical protein PLICRDRAFT_129539 [Plicaturopsis crispa FD-325 SS-3]|nr:hypothetical protein PLICRDRAFT_129539 [Plicaturopsis crispa FD-325 SS-3]